jgi:hypothetical protein
MELNNRLKKLEADLGADNVTYRLILNDGAAVMLDSHGHPVSAEDAAVLAGEHVILSPEDEAAGYEATHHVWNAWPSAPVPALPSKVKAPPEDPPDPMIRLSKLRQASEEEWSDSHIEIWSGRDGRPFQGG